LYYLIDIYCIFGYDRYTVSTQEGCGGMAVSLLKCGRQIAI
jgi:hypothetical protein